MVWGSSRRLPVRRAAFPCRRLSYCLPPWSMCCPLQPQKRGVSKGFVLPEGGQRGKTPHLCGFGRMGSSDRPLRAAVFRQNKPLRNITVFSHGYENISAAVPGEKQAGDKDGRERPAAEIFLRPHTPPPCANHSPVLQSIEERRNQHGRRKSKKDIA